jgi:hypothetical protein
MVEEKASAERKTNPSFLKDVVWPNPGLGTAAIAGAILFVVTPSLALFGSDLFLLLFIPAVLLSGVRMRQSNVGGPKLMGAIARTGFLMVFNGAVLIVAMFVLGFLADFVIGGEREVKSQMVGFSFTIVHIMLGVGLLLVDNYRHMTGD